MADLVSAVGVNTTTLSYSDQAELRATADANSKSQATSVNGIAEAQSEVTKAVGVLDSSITAGGAVAANIIQNGVADADATTVNKVGNPASSAFAWFTGQTGGMLDSTATDVDVTVGDNADINVRADNVADADAGNVAGAALAKAQVNETYGLENIGVSVGADGTVLADVDVDSTASAATVGASGATADANAEADATNVVAIQDLGGGSAAANSTFGGDALITANAGTSADRVKLAADATTTVGDATATSDSTLIAGIDGDGTEIVQVGGDASVTARGYADLDAAAVSTTGDSTAASTAAAVNGAEIDTLNVGADGVLKGFAATDADVSAATATGSADADNTLSESKGLDLDILSIGGDALDANGNTGVVGSAVADLSTSADAVTSTADADGAVGTAIGADLGATTVGNDASIAGVTDLNGTAAANSVGGAATANSIATTSTGTKTSGATSIGADGNLSATADSNQLAQAVSVDANADADATTTTNIGLDADSTTTIGGTASLNAKALNSNVATATSTDATATATADADNNVGADVEGAIAVGAGGSFTGVADLNLAATALTVGNDSAADVADANAGTDSNNIALSLDEASTSFGADASLIGDADLDASASATGTEADTTADVDLGQAGAIDITGQTITFGDGGTVGANSRVGTKNSALTVDGDASADTIVDRVYGLGDGTGNVTIGGTGLIDADALATNTATAAATVADSAVSATINNDVVEAINADTLTTGADLALDADAASTQMAVASNIGAVSGANTATVSATVGTYDAVKGIASTVINAGGDVSQLTADASLSGSATASNVNATGAATATAGSRDDVAAIEGSAITVGGSLLNGLSAQGTNTLTATADGVAGNALATAGGTGTAAQVQGMEGSDLTVGGNAGTVVGSATTAVNATASSVDGIASAAAGKQATGVQNSAIAIGGDGNLSAVGSAVANATAVTVDGFIAAATTDLNVQGLEQGSSDTTVIGASGNVVGQAFASGAASSESVAGLGAFSNAAMVADGIKLNANSADITIGDSGSISGLSVVGDLANGTLANGYTVTASSTDGFATALGRIDATGITGVDGGTTLTAGPSGGDVSGQVLAGASVVASNVGNAARATIDGTGGPADLVGLLDVDIVAGQAGSNMVKGTAFGEFDAVASSVAGDATGRSDVNANGILDAQGDGTISVAGGLQAIAQLTNSVTSTTVEGNATAEVISDAVGLSGYTVTMVGSGPLIAQAFSNSEALASSVDGSARA